MALLCSNIRIPNSSSSFWIVGKNVVKGFEADASSSALGAADYPK